LEKRWSIGAQCLSNDNLIELILDKKGVTDKDKFLNSTLRDLHDPSLLPNVDKAVDTVDKYKGKKLTVYGDYDVDGVTSTALLVLTFRELGYDVDYYIPDRSEGYGLNCDAIAILHANGTKLIITCDCGISGIKEVEYAKTLGIEVIITDHHEPQAELPKAAAIIDPKCSNHKYPFDSLAGVGVAWKFAAVLYRRYGFDPLVVNKYLDLVTLGTIADVVDLVDENRIIVKYGLDAIKHTKRIGLEWLLGVKELKDKEITPYNVGFVLAPCINATGRLETAHKAVELLITKSPLKALRIAKELVQHNKDRQELQAQVYERLLEKLRDTEDLICVHYEVGLPEGLLGLIAGKIREELNRPVILLTNVEHTEFIKGSGRSIDGYDMFDAIGKHKSMLTAFGGHKVACGLTIHQDNLELFKQAVLDNCILTEESLIRRIRADFEVEPSQMTMEFTESLQQLAPFGKGNSRPNFMMRDLRIETANYMGANKQHLKLICRSDKKTYEFVGWNMAEQFEEMGTPVFVDIVFSPDINVWNNKRSLQLKIEDFKES